MGIHLNPVIFTAALVRWLEGAAVGRAGEGEEFVVSVAQAAEGTASAVSNAIPNGFAPSSVAIARYNSSSFTKA